MRYRNVLVSLVWAVSFLGSGGLMAGTASAASGTVTTPYVPCADYGLQMRASYNWSTGGVGGNLVRPYVANGGVVATLDNTNGPTSWDIENWVYASDGRVVDAAFENSAYGDASNIFRLLPGFKMTLATNGGGHIIGIWENSSANFATWVSFGSHPYIEVRYDFWNQNDTPVSPVWRTCRVYLTTNGYSGGAIH